MNTLIPRRIDTVNAKSSYDFWRLLAKYYPNDFKRQDIVDNSGFYPNFNENSRSDKIKAHLSYGVESGVIKAVNSHFEFSQEVVVHDFFEALKEGNVTREKETFRKLIRAFPLIDDFLKRFGSNSSVTVTELTAFIENCLTYDNKKEYKLAARFLAHTLKKASVIEEYKPKKQILILNRRLRKFVGQKTLTSESKIVTSLPIPIPVAVKDYSITITVQAGDSKTYQVSFQKMLKLIGILENEKDIVSEK